MSAVNYQVDGIHAPDPSEPENVEHIVNETGEVVTPAHEATQKGTAAARLRAKAQELRQRTKRFDVPPDDVWGGELVLVAHPVEIKSNMPNVKLIFDATERLELLDPDTGQFEEIQDGWFGVGRLMGLTGDEVTAGQIITAVCSSKEVVGGLAEQVLAFIMGRQSQIEQALGE